MKLTNLTESKVELDGGHLVVDDVNIGSFQYVGEAGTTGLLKVDALPGELFAVTTKVVEDLELRKFNRTNTAKTYANAMAKLYSSLERSEEIKKKAKAKLSSGLKKAVNWLERGA